MPHLSLDIANWTVKAVGDLSAVPAALRHQQVPTIVPGCVHTDLFRARLIPDPLVGMNEQEVQWIGETDWEYRASFEADPDLLKHERIDLVCDGLDTIAGIALNGVHVGRAANMFHPHRFDLRPAVRAEANEISITFLSPLKYIRAEEQRLGKRPINGDWDPYVFIRKTACNFGWDWAPKLATCGIWKSLRVEAWNMVRIAQVRPMTHRQADHSWQMDVVVDLEWSGSAPAGTVLVGVEVDAEDDEPSVMDSAHDTVAPGTKVVHRSLSFSKITEWSPGGIGMPTVYPLNVWVTDNYETESWRVDVLDERKSRFGFREVKLKTLKDEHGTDFTIEVNGRDVFCKGANWIPDGPWTGQASRDICRKRLEQALAANMNMLRVWGGGYYESDAFYELCDELGIMVWQDFMFACAMYPEEEPYPKLIEAEARHQISRLASHPSVVLWCGGNECVWAHDAWGNAPGEKPWKDRLEGKTWGEGYYFDLLPRLLKELDPTRPYWPNSPWPGSKELPPNSADHGDRHTWDQRGNGYRNVVPRFCSEFGHQSPSNYATLARVLTPEDLKIGSPALEHRQRGTGGTAKHIDEAIAELFRPPRDFDEWHYLAQLTQARAMKTGIEWMRVNQPRCMGALVWQLNDCWPGMSWSLIDSDGREKLAYHAAKASFRNRLITIQPFDGRPWLCIVNDDEKPSRYMIEAMRMDFDGNVLASAELEADASPLSVCRVCDLSDKLGQSQDPTREFIVADSAGQRATWFYFPDRELKYPTSGLDTSFKSVRIQEDEVIDRVLHLHARTLIRDATLFPERSSTIKTAWNVPVIRTLLPGEEVLVSITSKTGCGGGSELNGSPRPPVFLCANMFGAGV